jgi:phasin family protein
MDQQQLQLLDLYRAGLKGPADLMKATLESVERLQNQQLSVIRQALDEQTKSLAAMSSAKTVDELMTLQARMAATQVERAVGFWFGQMQTNVEQARDWFSRAATQGEASTRQVEKASATTTR